MWGLSVGYIGNRGEHIFTQVEVKPVLHDEWRYIGGNPQLEFLSTVRAWMLIRRTRFVQVDALTHGICAHECGDQCVEFLV